MADPITDEHADYGMDCDLSGNTDVQTKQRKLDDIEFMNNQNMKSLVELDEYYWKTFAQGCGQNDPEDELIETVLAGSTFIFVVELTDKENERNDIYMDQPAQPAIRSTSLPALHALDQPAQPTQPAQRVTTTDPGHALASELSAGVAVDVQPRMWAGMNKPGGVGHIKSAGVGGTFNVKYILGRSERNVALRFIFLYQPNSIRAITRS
jgi:hypothetical protein